MLMRKTVNKIWGKAHLKMWNVKITITPTSNCYLYKQSWLMTFSHKRCWLGFERFDKQIISTLPGEEKSSHQKYRRLRFPLQTRHFTAGCHAKSSNQRICVPLSGTLTTVVALFGFRIFFFELGWKVFIYRNPLLYKPFENGNLLERWWCNRCWRCVQFIWE